MEKIDEQFAKIHEVVGWICVSFESLDLLLSATVNKLISDDPDIGSIITSEMAFKNLVHAFSSLTKYKYSDQQDLLIEIDKLIRELNEAEEKRNQIIHSTYANKVNKKKEVDIQRIKITARQKRGLRFSQSTFSENDLKEIGNQIVNTMVELESLHFYLFNGETPKL